MRSDAVSNTGPILHLKEIELANAFRIFSSIKIPPAVESELRKKNVKVPREIKIVYLKSEFKDRVKIIANQHNLDLGESEAIALCMQEKSDYFLTDDLEARSVAKNYNLEVHGTIGIVLRAFRQKIINKKTAIKKIEELYSRSSLFITKDLVDAVVKEINKFSRR